MQRKRDGRVIRVGGIAVRFFLTTSLLAQAQTPSTLAPASTSARQIFDLSIFVISIASGIFVFVGGLLALALVRFRARKSDPPTEPAQIYGSTQIELAWTVVPVLIVVVLFANDSPTHFCKSRRAKTQHGVGCHSNRSSVLVGISISQIWCCDC
jgi:cytochrome c oxidase subunit 2